MDLTVYSLSQAKRHKRKFDAVITLEAPQARYSELLRFTQLPMPAHLVLHFEDLDEPFPRTTTATVAEAQRIIDFGRQHAGKRILCHCQAGVGRSGAAGYALLADHLGPGREAEALQTLMQIRPEACPNLLLTKAADDVLGRNGALYDALMAEHDNRPNWHVIRKNKADFYHKNPEQFS